MRSGCCELLEECPVGGLLLFNGGVDAKKSLERLQAASSIPLLVGSDIERGVGQQVRGCTIFPHAAAFDRLGADAESAVADYARTLAREARDVGIHITFAPSADVNSNRRNPIINTRAFSDDTARAAAVDAGLRCGGRDGRAIYDGQTFSRPWRNRT